MSRFVVVLDGESGAFGVVVPDLPGCTSAGETIDGALINVAEAIRLWIEDAEADGEAVPQPTPAENLRHDPAVAEAIAGAASIFI